MHISLFTVDCSYLIGMPHVNQYTYISKFSFQLNRVYDFQLNGAFFLQNERSWSNVVPDLYNDTALFALQTYSSNPRTVHPVSQNFTLFRFELERVDCK